MVLPNSLPDLVEEDGGGGVSICEAVGARDWRIEYVRCILKYEAVKLGLVRVAEKSDHTSGWGARIVDLKFAMNRNTRAQVSSRS